MICNTTEVDVYQPGDELLKKEERTFDYTLNNKRANAKLLKGAKRVNSLLVERKTGGSITFLFCDGSYFEVVLPLLRIWQENLNKIFVLDGFEIKIIDIKIGREDSGKQMDTKVTVLVNNDRFVLHAYNSTQKLMIQGKNNAHFAENCLEPFFKQRIEEAREKIMNFNSNVQSTLASDKSITGKKCPQCEFKTLKSGDLKVHMKFCHTKPSITSPSKNKVPRILNEDMSILDDSVVEVIDFEEGTEDQNPIALTWETCDNNSKEECIIAEPIEKEHIPTLNEKHLSPKTVSYPVIEDGFNCYICGFETETQGEFEKHQKRMHSNNKNDEERADARKETTSTDVSVVNMMERYTETLSCGPCEKIFRNENEYNVHMSEHRASNVFHCDVCENNFETDFELEWHEETSHITEDRTIFKCEVCAQVFFENSDLSQHKQAYHMSVSVNVDTIEQNAIACNLCHYRCRYNIQLRKHLRTTHVIEQKYTCKFCDFSTDFVANTWEHMLWKHPDQSSEFEGRQQKDLILKLVAEQNAEIIYKLDKLGGALVELTNTVNAVKIESDDKCSTLADGIMKLSNRFKKVKNKTEEQAKVIKKVSVLPKPMKTKPQISEPKIPPSNVPTPQPQPS